MATLISKLLSRKGNILKTLAAVARFPRLREFFAVVSTGFAKGQIKSVTAIGEHLGVQTVVSKFSKKDTMEYTKHLVPLGFIEAAEIRAISMKAIRREADKLTDLSFAREQEILDTLEEHIDHLREESFFQKAHRDAQKENIIGRSPSAREWYQDYAVAYGTGFSYTTMLKEGGTRAGRPMLGKMMFFKYRPDVVESTYDLYPLIFVLNRKPGYFDGINFHYVVPKMRAVLLGNMFTYLSNLNFDLSTELNFKSFRNAIGSNKKFKFAKASVRRYNYSNIQSKIINVHPLDWELAIMVDTEKFFDEKNSRATSQTIWKETRINVASN